MKKYWIQSKNPFHGRWKKIINDFAKKTFSVSEGALFSRLKLWSVNWKIHADVKVLYSKNYLFLTTSVDFLVENLEFVKTKNFIGVVKQWHKTKLVEKSVSAGRMILFFQQNAGTLNLVSGFKSKNTSNPNKCSIRPYEQGHFHRSKCSIRPY